MLLVQEQTQREQIQVVWQQAPLLAYQNHAEALAVGVVALVAPPRVPQDVAVVHQARTALHATMAII